MKLSKITQTKCPKCGNIIDSWHYRTITISDNNTLKCSKCNNVFDSEENFVWNKQKPIEKAMIIVIFMLQNLWYSFVTICLILVVLELLFNYKFFLNGFGQPTTVSITVATLIPIVISIIRTIIFYKNTK